MRALSVHVAKLEQQHRDALGLAGEVIATLRLNATTLAPTKPDAALAFAALVEKWRRRLEELDREANRG